MEDALRALVPGVEVDVRGAAGGPLFGLTFVVKDLFDIAGLVTGCGNPDWLGFAVARPNFFLCSCVRH